MENLLRDDDGAIEFWRIKDDLRNHFLYCHHLSDDKWKKSMEGGGNKKRFQCCTDSSGAILYLRALQGHSGRILIDPSLQDNVVIPDNFFEYINHIGCAINLHSIMKSGLIRIGQNLSNRQTVFFSACGSNEQGTKRSGCNQPGCTASCLVHAESMEETSKYAVLGLHQPCSKERIEVLSITIERYHSSRNTPSSLYPESCEIEDWRSQIRKSICVTSASSKDLLENMTGWKNWVQKLLNDQRDKLFNNPKVPHQTN